MVLFAAIAAVVLFMLYNVLGKRVGRQPQEDAKLPAPTASETPVLAQRAPLDSITMAAISSLRARDPGFDPSRFIEGSRQAYETIVRG
ncbi:MAG TPA: Tim44/TimA family putative adaptor protein, partial [Brevundimonas sp.]